MKLFTTILFFAFTTISISAQNEKQPTMKDWKYPYDVKNIQLNDSIDVAYIAEGKGKCTLLFIHGLGSYFKAWTKNVEALKSEYRCIALDLPGYGKSSKMNYPYSMTFFAETIRAFIKKMELKDVILVGHSMGGQIAMQTVLQNDKNIKKLILLAPAGFETFTEEESLWLQTVYTADVIKATPEAQIVKNFEINFHQMPDDARFMIDDRMTMRQTPKYDQYCEMIPKCVKGMLDEPVFERLTEIYIPTLVMYGKNDSLIPNPFLHANLTVETVAKNGHEKLPKSNLEMIPSAGHFVQWEQSELVNSAIFNFLK